MSNILIECRQKSARSVTDNGDYEVLLDKAIAIDRGDQLVVHNCFLDTTVIDPTKIEVAEDIVVKTSQVLYTRWHSMDNKTGSTATAHNRNNFTVYSQARTDMGTAIENSYYRIFTSATFEAVDSSKSFGGCTLTFTYTSGVHLFNEDGSAPIMIKLPTTSGDETYTRSFRLLGKTGTLGCSSHTVNQLATLFNVKVGTIVEQALGASDKFIVPRVFDHSFTIPKGLWDPDDLCSHTNEQFTRIDTQMFAGPDTGVMLPATCPFLVGTEQFPFYTDDTYAVMASETDFYYYTAQNEAIGTSQIEFAFDANTQKMKINFLHMPLYDTSKNICVVPTASDDVWYLSGSNGGTRFVNLEPSTFFEDKLGFDIETVCAPIQVSTSTHTATATGESGHATLAGTYYMPDVDLTVGTNVTSAYVGIDVAVQKSTSTTLNTFPASGTVDTPIIVGTDTEPIIASNPINNIGISSGYFVVEVDCLFKSSFIGMDAYSGSIRSIVSRYYTANNYTSSDSDSIVYQNRGVPAMLSLLKIRILNPDQSLITNLGEDNTVFLRLVKSGAKPASERQSR